MENPNIDVFICKICESDSKPHKALGMCGTCYRKDRIKRIPQSSFCEKCKQTLKSNQSRKMCATCYQGERCKRKLLEGWVCPLCGDPSRSFKSNNTCNSCWEEKRHEKKKLEGWICPICEDSLNPFKCNNMCRICYARERRKKIYLEEWSCKICGDSQATIKAKKMCDICHKYSRLAVNSKDENDPLNAVVSLYELLDETEKFIKMRDEANEDETYDRISSKLYEIMGMEPSGEEENHSDRFDRILCLITGALTERIRRIEMDRVDMNMGETKRRRRKK